MFSTIRYEAAEKIATITLNRADKLNAFNPLMREELCAAFDLSDADDEVRAVIVTGAGRAFCAGGEVAVRQAASATESSAVADRDDGGLVTLRIFDSLKPVIAAINGAAVGFGATAPLAMDFRLASEKARFGFGFAGLGVVPEAAATWFLPRLVGMQTSLEWCLTGQLISAGDALTKGLLRSVHAPDDLMPAATALARTIADRAAPVSAALVRQMLWRNSAAPHPMEAHIVESTLIHERKQGRDIDEGIASFLQKRSPLFTDRVSADMPSSYPWWQEPPYRPSVTKKQK
jgi:enoyl-CoA hydratase/carnithine racemase